MRTLVGISALAGLVWIPLRWAHSEYFDMFAAREKLRGREKELLEALGTGIRGSRRGGNAGPGPLLRVSLRFLMRIIC